MQKAKRIASYDLIRVVAMFFVVSVHSLPALDNDWPYARLVATVGKTLFFSANAMFFMMSGRFNLKERPDGPSLLAYYRNKFKTIILPVLVLFFLRTVWENRDSLAQPRSVLQAFLLNTAGRFAGMEYWFMFTLIGFLLVSPFLAHISAKIKGPELIVFISIAVCLDLFQFVAVNKSIPFAWTNVFSGFLLAYMLGPILDPMLKKTLPIWFWLAGFACFVITVALSLRGWGQTTFDISPFYLGSSVTIYAALYKAGTSAGTWAPIRFASPHSFTVYMVHGAVIGVLSGLIPKMAGWHSFVGFLFTAITATAISLALSLCLDRILLRPLQRLFERICPNRQQALH